MQTPVTGNDIITAINKTNNRPPVGVPTLWMGPKPDWALDFGNGASTKYLWANYPELNNSDFKAILDCYKTTGGSGLCADYDSTGFYVPDLRGMMPKVVGTTGKSYGHDAIAKVGAVLTERLPNIKGEDIIGFNQNYWGIINDIGGQSGAFIAPNPRTVGSYGHGTTGTYSGNLYLGVNFNAHNSNAIYTDSAHVSPLSVGAMYIVRFE